MIYDYPAVEAVTIATFPSRRLGTDDIILEACCIKFLLFIIVFLDVDKSTLKLNVTKHKYYIC